MGLATWNLENLDLDLKVGTLDLRTFSVEAFILTFVERYLVVWYRVQRPENRYIYLLFFFLTFNRFNLKLIVLEYALGHFYSLHAFDSLFSLSSFDD